MDQSQAGIKITGRNNNNLRYAGDTTLMAKSEEELKNLLMKAKRGEWKSDLKLNIQKTKIIVFGPITSWQTDTQWQTSFSWVPKSLWTVTAAMKLKDSCSLEEKL